MAQAWKMVKERIQKEDGRYLVYYRFPEGSKSDRNTGSGAATAPDGGDKTQSNCGEGGK